MSDHKVNTDKVYDIANSIHQANQDLHLSFSNVTNAVNKLNGTWDGGAAWAGENAFNKIKNKYERQRYSVIENYVKILTQ